MTEATTQTLPEQGTAKAFGQEDFDLARVRDRQLISQFVRESDPFPQYSRSIVAYGYINDLEGGSRADYSVNYDQVLKWAKDFLRRRGWPMVSGDCANMAVVICSESRIEDKEDTGVASFLGKIYALAESKQVRQAAAKIMEYTDSLLLDGRFDICSILLSQVDVDRLAKHPTLLVAFLGITLGAKGKLGETREVFYVFAEAALSHGELGPERAKRILRRFQ